MKRFAPSVLTLVLAVGVVLTANIASAQQNNIPPSNPNCSPLGHTHVDGQHYPTTIEPEFSVWCYQQPAAISPTRSVGANDWVDTFDNSAPSITKFNDHDMGYRVLDVFHGPEGAIARGYFVNVDHWMLDMADVSNFSLSAGVLVSPDRSFRFENGKLVVEVDAAAGSDGMGGADRFYEIDISPAAATTQWSTDTLYGYGSFGGIGAMGCRLERTDAGGGFVCAMYDNSNRVTGGECPDDGRVCTNNGGRPGRAWETQGVGTNRTARSVTGGYPGYQIPGTNLQLKDVWRMCAANELDLHCRDRFRMEITKDSIHLFVNGYPAMQIDGLYAVNPETGADNRIPDSWFSQGVRPYFTSWINGGQHTPTRWHWDRIAVNPHDGSGNFAAPSAAPSFCLGQPNNTCPDPAPPGSGQPTPTSQPVPPTPTRQPVPPTPTPVPTTPPAGGAGAQTINFDNLANPNRPLNGQYPTGLIDWGSNRWYLSGPFGAFTTNSIGFNGSGPTSAGFNFVNAKRVVGVDAYNGGNAASTVTVSCPGQQTVQRSLAVRQLMTIQTGWSGTCTSVTLGSSNGWNTNFDNLSIDNGQAAPPPPPPGKTQTVDFNNQNNPNRPLNGQYPSGVIDWGTGGWYLSGPYGGFASNSVGFNGASFRSQGFGFISPKTLVKVDAFNGGDGASTVTLSCQGRPTVSVNLAAHSGQTITTGWTAACQTVTVTSSNGWDTNFDNFVIQ